jgi:putative glutathione S-transferase
MFNGAFGRFTNVRTDYYPQALRDEIDRVNTLVYENINNGVYRTGFATTQEAYEDAFASVFAALDELEARLARQRYLAGKEITEADWRLFPTLIRDSPYEPRTGVKFCALPAFWQDRRVARTTAVTSGSSNGD